MTSTNGKAVIYVDVDDEITGIIDKVTSTDAKVVALVLPKRAAVFQSIVNMKLLKRRADSAKKHLVLITSESGLMPLAGTVGLYIAKTLQSKPEIPPAVAVTEALEDTDEAVPVEGDFDPKELKDKPVGELAGETTAAGTAVGASHAQMPEESIELDNTDAEPPTPSISGDKNVAAMASKGAAGKVGKHGKDKSKKLKVPNFERFRLLLVVGALVIILLIAAFIVANRILPAAKVTITTNSSTINANPTLTLNTSATSVNTSTDVIPAETQQVQKTYTQTVPATGKQNNGTKATGSVTMTAQECAPSIGTPTDIAAGTGISENGLTFVTQGDTPFNPVPDGGSGSCVDYTAMGPTTITAQTGGSSYNVPSGTTFSVAGRSDATATGSTSGGTDNIVTIVQQSDIDGAKAKLTNGQSTGSIKQQLEEQLQSNGMYAIPATYSTSTPNITTSNNVGDTVNDVTVTENITYTMFGVRKSDLQTALDKVIKGQINANKQGILNDGLSNATYTAPSPGSSTQIQVNMQATAMVGPKINQPQLKAQIGGEKSGDAEQTIEAIPGVQEVNVKLSPFWVSSVPKKTSKVTFVFVKSSSDNGN